MTLRKGIQQATDERWFSVCTVIVVLWSIVLSGMMIWGDVEYAMSRMIWLVLYIGALVAAALIRGAWLAMGDSR